ncbi:metallophosphoesterase family protein [Paenibacillus sp. 1001270B_150601_E10]|uniref:metallophosphoesterase family protein n=1 Tax=Paenibacillus sp. 1001270B_150601_E10 TaxID=2787079 RepID=UPI00189C7BFF|nr:metallophosphoesterase [Paenibacillus sp. 1001270B_150601_E10]
MSKVTFAVMTDLHHEHVADSLQRVEAFVDRANKANADFIIQLGDLSNRKEPHLAARLRSLCKA